MKITKKMLSLLMAMTMVVTMLPAFALSALGDEPKDRYLFSYFTGNSTEQQRIKFALSEDGTSYNAINKNDPVIKQNLGTGCCRDPYIFRGQDGKYYAIATDMDASGGWWGNSNSFVIWRSNDLVTWSNETIIRVDQITGVDVYRAWAPQVIWDASENKYMVYFGLAANGYSAGGTKMHYMYTDDLLDQSKYTVPQPMMKNNAVANNDSIDADITEYNGTFYMFFKDEGNATICIVTSDTLHGPYNTDNIVPLAAGNDIGALEGCQVWWNEDSSQYVLMADRYSANGVFACYNIGANLDTFYSAVSSNHNISGYYNADMSSKISVLGPRHGSIINITESQYNAIINTYGIATNEDVRYNFNSQNYVAENSWHYDSVQDTSGYTYDVMTNSGQYTYTYTDEHYISLNGSVVFINDPAVKAMLHENKWTVSFDVSVAETRNAPIFALTSGDSPASSIDWIRFLDSGEAYLYKNGAYTSIGSTQMLSSVEYTMTVTYNGSTIKFYKDGVLFAEDEIGVLGYDNSKSTNYAAFGWTDTCGVSGVHGAFTNVRFRNKAISASQVASESAIGSELLYRYNEGTAEINGRINSTDCGASGVTTSMTGARGASYTIAGWFNVGSSREGSLFSLGWGGTGDNKQYLNFREDGVINYCWNEGSTDHYYDSSSVYTFDTNTWYYVQINIVPDGNSCHFRTFVNGVSVNDQTTGYTRMTTHAYNPHSFFMQNSIEVRLGTTNVSWWNQQSNSKIDDFRVYTKAIDAAVLYQKQKAEDRAEAAGQSGASQGADIDEAMGIFEARVAQMANNGYSKLWTNCAPAYAAYKIAVRDKGTIGESDALAGLNEALANMEPFVPQTGKANPSGTNFNVSNTASETYFRNVIYSEGANPGKVHEFNEDDKCIIYDSWAAALRYGSHAYIYYPQTVVLYDGINTPVVPVVAGFKNTDNRYAVNVVYLDENSGEFDLTEDWWHGYDSSTTFKWPEANDADITTDHDNRTEYNNAWTPSDGDKTHYYLYKNGFEYTGTPASTYNCISSTNWELLCQYGSVSKQNPGGTITNSTPDIVVIDYKRLTDALSAASNSATNKGYLGDLEEKYKSGGLEGLFEAYDAGTTLDPNTGCSHFNHTYAYSTNMDAEALECADDIDSAVKLLNTISITTDAATFKDLCDAIENYEKAMADMDEVCFNLEPAYKAYLVALEYKDAYFYGGRRDFESPTLAKAAQDLVAETAKMTPYDVPEFNAGIIKYPNDTADVGSSYHKNIVYWGTPGGTMTYSNKKSAPSGFAVQISKNDSIAAVTHPTTVLVYDGVNNHTPKMPILGAAYRENTNDRNIWYMYPTVSTSSQTKHSDFEMDDEWHGDVKGHDMNQSNTPASWTTAWGYAGRGNKTNSLPSGSSYICGFYNKPFLQNPYCYSHVMANTMSYTGSGDTTAYYKKYLLPWTTEIGSNTSEVPKSTDQAYSTSSVPIYVINYKPLKEKIESITIAKGSLAVTDYKEGGLDEWLAKLDSLTKIDPNQYDSVNHPHGYDYASNPEAATIECANDILAVLGENGSGGTASDITGTPSGTPDSQISVDGDYTALKEAIDEIENAPDEQGCIKSATWQAYLDAVADARQAMYDIANSQSGTTTGKAGYTGDDIDTLADTLSSSIDDLYVFANSAHPLMFSYKENGTHNYFFQCDLNHSHILDNNTHETVIDADGSAYDAMTMVYKTLDRTRYKDLTVINAGKRTFDEVKTVAHPGGMTPQIIVDDGVSALITAINESNEVSGIHYDDPTENPYVQTYDITFKVYTDGATEAAYSETVKHLYGDTPVLDVTASAPLTAIQAVEGYESVTASTLEVDHWEIGGKRISSREKTLKVNNQADVTIEAFVKPPVEGKKLVIKDVSGNVFYTLAVKDETTIAMSSSDLNTITVGGTNYSIPNSLSYKVSGWTVDYEGNYTEFDTTVGDLAKGDELVLKPIKEYIQPKADNYTFKMDGVPTSDDAVAYDYRLRVNADEDLCEQYGGEAVGIVFYNSDHNLFVPVTYGSTYSFFANRSMDFYTLMYISNEAAATSTLDAGYYLPGYVPEGGTDIFKVTDEELIFHLDYRMPMVYSYSEPTGANQGTIIEGGQTIDGYRSDRWTTRSAFTAEVGGGGYGAITIDECGTLRTSTIEHSTESELVVENFEKDGYSDIKMKINTNRDKESNQYSYSLPKAGSEYATAYTRAYVKYSYTYKGAEIHAVAYGPVCASYYGGTAE